MIDKWCWYAGKDKMCVFSRNWCFKMGIAEQNFFRERDHSERLMLVNSKNVFFRSEQCGAVVESSLNLRRYLGLRWADKKNVFSPLCFFSSNFPSSPVSAKPIICWPKLILWDQTEFIPKCLPKKCHLHFLSSMPNYTTVLNSISFSPPSLPSGRRRNWPASTLPRAGKSSNHCRFTDGPHHQSKG